MPLIRSGLYGWDATPERLSRERKRCILLTACSAALTVACGLIPTAVTRHNWVSFAGTAALVAVLLEIAAVGRFCVTKTQLDYRTFHSIHWMMDYGPLLHMMLMAVALISGIVSCIQGFGGILDLAALVGFALAGISSWFLRKGYQTIPTYQLKEEGY